MNLYQPTISGSLTVSGSVIVDGTIIMTSGSISGTASLAENSLLLNNLNSSSFAGTGSFLNVSSSFAATSGSLSTRVTNLEATSSVLTTASASFATTSGSLSSRVTIIEGQDATTGSNTFTGVQYVNEASNAISFTSTASLYTDGGLRVAKDSYVSGTAYFNNITVYGTSSIEYITSSQVNIGSNIITVNTDTPAVRFGGLSVFDSGSTQLTGSLFWDSEKNHWIYSNPSGSSYNSGMIMSGPRNSGSLGDEQGTTLNALMKGQGGDHITSSQIFDDGTTVRIPGALQVTGSLSGSSTTFSGVLTAQRGNFYQSADSGFAVAMKNRNANQEWGLVVDTDAVDDKNLGFYSTQGSLYALKLASSTGAATFSGALTGSSATFSGRVGIGTSSPDYILTINANASQTSFGIMTGYSNSNARNWGIGTNVLAFGDFTINQSNALGGLPFGAGTSRLYISQAGNVGIGTTSPGRSLNISGTGTDGTQVQINGTGDSAGIKLIPVSGDNWEIQANTSNQFFVYNRTDSAYRFLIDGTGNVGIGTSSPSCKLQIADDTISNASGGNEIKVYGSVSSGDAAQLYLYQKWNSLTYPVGIGASYDGVYGAAAAAMSFYVSAFNGSGVTTTRAMYINPAGSVGIGTTSPSGIFEVYKSNSAGLGGAIILNNNGSAVANETAVIFQDGGTTGVRAAISSTVDDSPYNGDIKFKTGLGLYSSLTTRIKICPDGTLAINGTNDVNNGRGIDKISFGHYSTYGWIQTWNATSLYLNKIGNAVYAGTQRIDNNSDARIKDNIESVTNALDTILSLKGRKFNMKDENGKLRYGFVAQEVQPHLADFVTESDRTFEKDDIRVENLLTLETSGASWAALLVEAIKELKAEFDEYKTTHP